MKPGFLRSVFKMICQVPFNSSGWLQYDAWDGIWSVYFIDAKLAPHTTTNTHLN